MNNLEVLLDTCTKVSAKYEEISESFEYKNQIDCSEVVEEILDILEDEVGDVDNLVKVISIRRKSNLAELNVLDFGSLVSYSYHTILLINESSIYDYCKRPYEAVPLEEYKAYIEELNDGLLLNTAYATKSGEHIMILD